MNAKELIDAQVAGYGVVFSEDASPKQLFSILTALQTAAKKLGNLSAGRRTQPRLAAPLMQAKKDIAAAIESIELAESIARRPDSDRDTAR